MRKARAIVFVTAIGLVFLGLATIQAQEPGGAGAPERDLGERSERFGAPWEPIAPPKPIPTSPTGAELGFQLVGFTTERFDGNRGVLNLTRACQRSFQASRICTADEISQSILIPVPAAYGYAWILDTGGSGSRLIADCRGWTSDAPEVTGKTIEIGPESGCYGGFLYRGCNEEHRVACCARVSADAQVAAR